MISKTLQWRILKPLIALPLAGVVLLLALGITRAAALVPDKSFGISGSVIAPEMGGGAALRALARDPAGRILASGVVDGAFGVVRYRSNGEVETSFGDDGVAFTEFEYGAAAEGVAVQRDGKVVAAGYSRVDDDVGGIALARYNEDGSPDLGFGDSGKVESRDRQQGAGFDVALQPGGRILVAGTTRAGTLRPKAVVVAYTRNGKVDRSFGKRGAARLSGRRGRVAGLRPFTAFTDLEVLRSGKILAAGYQRRQLLLARLTRNGALDRSFGGGDGKVLVRLQGNDDTACIPVCDFAAAVGVQPGRRIVVQGQSGAAIVLARFRRNGRLDGRFGHRGKVFKRVALGLGHVDDMAVQPSGHIIVASDSERGGVTERTVHRFTVLRYRPDGRLDRGFGDNGVLVRSFGRDSAANGVLAQRNGDVVVGGNASTPAEPPFRESFVLMRFVPK